MGFLSKRKFKKQAYQLGRQTAEVMLNSTAAVIQDAGGIDKIRPGAICRKVLALRPEWRVDMDGTLRFADQRIEEWIGAQPGVVTAISDDTTIGNVIPTVIASEFTRLFTIEEGRSDFIVAAVQGFYDLFRAEGMVIRG